VSEVTIPINCLCLVFHAFSLDLAQWTCTGTRHMCTLELGYWYECLSVNHNILNLLFVIEVTHRLSLSMYKLCIIYPWFGRIKCLKFMVGKIYLLTDSGGFCSVLWVNKPNWNVEMGIKSCKACGETMTVEMS